MSFEDSWDDSTYSYTEGPEGGRYESGKTKESLSAEQRAWVRRTHHCHEPLPLLAAALAGEAQIAPGGADAHGPTLLVHAEGVTTRLSLHAETFRVVASEHRGWSGSFLGTVQRNFSGFQTVGPLLVATEVETGGRKEPWTTITVDGLPWPR